MVQANEVRQSGALATLPARLEVRTPDWVDGMKCLICKRGGGQLVALRLRWLEDYRKLYAVVHRECIEKLKEKTA